MSSVDDQIRAAFDRILVSLTGQLEADLDASASDIERAVADAHARVAAEAAERGAAEVRDEASRQLQLVQDQFERQHGELRTQAAAEIDSLREEIATVHAELTAARQELDERRQQHEAIEQQLAASRADADALRHSAAEMSAEVDSLRQNVDAVRAELATARQELDDRRHDHESIGHQLAASHSEMETLRRSAGEMVAQASSARRELDEARLAADDRLQQFAETQRLLDAAHHRIEQLDQDADRARREAADARRELDAIRAELGRADRVAGGLRSLDSATSLVAVLDGLARLARQAGDRAAIFLVDASTLRGWRALGFETDDAIVGMELASVEAGVVGDALSSGRGHMYPNGGGSALPAFAGSHQARRAVAVPVHVGDLVVAVLYADKPSVDASDDVRWPETVEGIARHAGRVLEAITVRHAAALWTPSLPAMRPGPIATGRGMG